MDGKKLRSFVSLFVHGFVFFFFFSVVLTLYARLCPQRWDTAVTHETVNHKTGHGPLLTAVGLTADWEEEELTVTSVTCRSGGHWLGPGHLRGKGCWVLVQVQMRVGPAPGQRDKARGRRVR